MTILHLAHLSDWQAALAAGEYRTSTRGATLDDVGFLHASYPEQVARVAEFVHAGGDGERYPHVHGPIRPEWVTAVRTASFDDGGRFHY